MQDAPNKETLLLAVAKFLSMEARPQVTDPRTSFRLLIAANICAVVAKECDSEEDNDRRALARYAEVFADVSVDLHGKAAKAAIAELDRKLAARLKNAAFAPGEWEKLRDLLAASLVDKLAVDNPRFDPTAEVL